MLRLFDVSTQSSVEVDVRDSGLISVKDFFEDVERSLTVKRGVRVSVLSAAVGDVAINVREYKKTVRYYLMDEEPWTIETEMSSKDCIALSIKEGAENFTLFIDSSKTVGDIKHKLSKMTCTKVNSVLLKSGDREPPQRMPVTLLLEENKLSYVLKKFKILAPYICISVGSTNEIAHKPKENEEPVWRRANPGMWMEGICMNEICVAYKKMVVMNKGFTDLDYVTDPCSPCPMCYSQVFAVQVGFTCCSFRTVGERAPLSLEQSMEQITLRLVKENWKTLAEDQYMTVSLIPGSWMSFKLVSRRIRRVHFCIICMSDIYRDLHKAPCGHVCHRRCLVIGGDNKCYLCLGRKEMTEFQMSFRAF